MNYKIDRETNFYIKLLEPLYKKTVLPDVDIREVNIDKLLIIAVKDNALYFTAKRLLTNQNLEQADKEKLQDIVSKGDKELEKIKETIKDIKRNIKNFIIFKTYKGANFTRIGNDIDVLIKYEDLYSSRDRLLSNGYHLFIDFPKFERAVLLDKKDRKKIHLQSRLYWCCKEYFDQDFLWRNPRTVKYNEEEIPINNVNADFLIHIAHTNYEHPYFKISELLYLFSLVPELDFDLLLEQTKKYGWHKTFLRTFNLMNNIHYVLYGQLLSKEVPFEKINIKEIKFPFEFSRIHMVNACIEKGITFYLLGRVFKILRVLLTGETVSYTVPPEREQYVKDGKPIIEESNFRKMVNIFRHKFLKLFDRFYNISE